MTGKVLWHFTMSLDGFVAGPGHTMDWMTGFTFRPGVTFLLGDGIRLYDNPGGTPVRLHHIGPGDPLAAVDLRLTPAASQG